MGGESFDYPTMARALIVGDKDTVARKTREGLDLSLDPKTLIFKGLIPGMDVVGEKFRRNEYYVPQVLLSALMTTTMPAMKRTIDALVRAGLRARVKVMVGGAPVSQAFASEIGADGYAKDSTLAVVKAKTLLGVGAEVAP